MTPLELADNGLPADLITTDTIESLVGAINRAQHQFVVTAIATDAQGTLDLARRIARKPGVRNRAAVLLTAISNGEHRRSKPTNSAGTQRSPIEKARGLYDVKLAELDRCAPHWPAIQRHEFAVDYALDHCGQVGLKPSDFTTGVQLQVDDEDDIPW